MTDNGIEKRIQQMQKEIDRLSQKISGFESHHAGRVVNLDHSVAALRDKIEMHVIKEDPDGTEKHGKLYVRMQKIEELFKKIALDDHCSSVHDRGIEERQQAPPPAPALPEVGLFRGDNSAAFDWCEDSDENSDEDSKKGAEEEFGKISGGALRETEADHSDCLDGRSSSETEKEESKESKEPTAKKRRREEEADDWVDKLEKVPLLAKISTLLRKPQARSAFTRLRQYSNNLMGFGLHFQANGTREQKDDFANRMDAALAEFSVCEKALESRLQELMTTIPATILSSCRPCVDGLDDNDLRRLRDLLLKEV